MLPRGRVRGAERVDRVERVLQDRAVKVARRGTEDQPSGGAHDLRRDAEEQVAQGLAVPALGPRVWRGRGARSRA